MQRNVIVRLDVNGMHLPQSENDCKHRDSGEGGAGEKKTVPHQ